MNFCQIKKTLAVAYLVSLHACSNPAPTPLEQSIQVGTTVTDNKFALNLPEIPGMATIGSEAKLKIVKGHVKFPASSPSCPEGAKSQFSLLPTTNIDGSIAAELASPFKAGQLLGPVTLQPGDFTVNLEIFERNLLAYFGTAQFSVQPGIITNLDLVLQKPFTCPKPNDGGVVINPGIPDGGVTINPVVPIVKKSACDFTGPITKECNVVTAYCEWKDPNTIGELDKAGLDKAGLDKAGLDKAGLDKAGLDKGGLMQASARCSEAAAKQALINQLCERNIMVGEKFLEEIYCSSVPIEPPPPVEETNKVSPFNGAVSATINGETIIKQDLVGFKEAATITVRGLAGDKVIWTNSVNSKTIETVLDGKGDYNDHGHNIDFGLKPNLSEPQANEISLTKNLEHSSRDVIWTATTQGIIKRFSMDGDQITNVQTWLGGTAGTGGYRSEVIGESLLLARFPYLYFVDPKTPALVRSKNIGSDSRTCIAAYMKNDKRFMMAVWGAGHFIEYPLANEAPFAPNWDAPTMRGQIPMTGTWGYSCFVDHSQKILYSQFSNMAAIDLSTYQPANFNLTAANANFRSQTPAVSSYTFGSTKASYAMGGDTFGNIYNAKDAYTSVYDKVSDSIWFSHINAPWITIISRACLTTEVNCDKYTSYSTPAQFGPMSALDGGRITALTRQQGQIFVMKLKDPTDIKSGLEVIKVGDAGGDPYVYSVFTGKSEDQSESTTSFDLRDASGSDPNRAISEPLLRFKAKNQLAESESMLSLKNIKLEVRCYMNANEKPAYEELASIETLSDVAALKASSCSSGRYRFVDLRMRAINGDSSLSQIESSTLSFKQTNHACLTLEKMGKSACTASRAVCSWQPKNNSESGLLASFLSQFLSVDSSSSNPTRSESDCGPDVAKRMVIEKLCQNPNGASAGQTSLSENFLEEITCNVVDSPTAHPVDTDNSTGSVISRPEDNGERTSTDNALLQNACGRNDEAAFNFAQGFTSLPIKALGSQMGVSFEITTQSKLQINSTATRSTKVQKTEVINSSAASGGFLGYIMGLFAPGMISQSAIDLAAESSGTFIFNSLMDNEWQSLVDSGHDQYKGLYCATKGSRAITIQNSSDAVEIRFSPAIVSSPSPFASIERLRRELGSERSFKVSANIQQGPSGYTQGTTEGTVTLREISPDFECQGVIKKADIAYEIVNDFPGGAHKVGLLKREAFYIDSQKNNFVAIIQESDKIDPKLKIMTPQICLLSDQEASTGSTTGSTTEPSQEPVSQPEPKFPVTPPEEDILTTDDGQKQDLVDLEFHVNRLPDYSRFQKCIFAQVVGQPEVELGCNRVAPGGALAPPERIVKMKILTNTCNQIRLYLKTNSGSGLRTIVSSEIPDRISSGVSRSQSIAEGPGINLVPLGGGGYVIEANDNNDRFWQDLQLKILPSIPPDTKFTFENTGIPCQ